MSDREGERMIDAPGGASAAGRLSRRLLPSAAVLLSDAFYSNPAHVYLCPDRRRRRKQLRWLLGAALRAQPDLSASFCQCEDGRVSAMGLWTRTDAPAPSLGDQLRAGLLMAPLRIGFAALRRATEVSDAVEGQLARALGGEPAWYLNNMAVREDWRGKGIGSALLGAEIEGRGADGAVARLALCTQLPENVRFYRRLGFEVASREPVGRGAKSFANWVMVRPNDGRV